MHTGNARHYWIDAAGQDKRAAVIAGLPVPPPLLPSISAHRRLRGPYTAAGTIMRALAADAIERFPALVAAHEIELRCVTPELRDRIPATRETLTSLAVPAERTRFYSQLRTLRIAHGLTEFCGRLHWNSHGQPAPAKANSPTWRSSGRRAGRIPGALIRRAPGRLPRPVPGSPAFPAGSRSRGASTSIEAAMPPPLLQVPRLEVSLRAGQIWP
jgi:hypothetical protein